MHTTSTNNGPWHPYFLLPNSDSHWRLRLWLLIGLCLYFGTFYFYSGTASDHRKIYYIAVFLPFLCGILHRPPVLRPVLRTPTFLMVVPLVVLAVATACTAAPLLWEQLYDAVRYGILILSFLALVAYVSCTYRSAPVVLLAVIALSSAAAAVYVSTLYFVDLGYVGIGRRMSADLVYGTNNPIRVAQHFSVGVLCALALFIFAPSLRSRVVCVSLATLSLLPILLSQSRGPLLGLLAAVFFTFILARRWKSVAGSMLVAALAVGIYMFMDTGYRDMLNPRTADIRFELWADTLQAATTDLWLGKGWTASSEVPHPTGGMSQHAHNVYLSVLYFGGVLGLIAFLALLLRGIIQSARLANVRVEQLAACSLLVYFAVNSLTTTKWIYDNPGIVWLEFWLPLSLVVVAEAGIAAAQNAFQSGHKGYQSKDLRGFG